MLFLWLGSFLLFSVLYISTAQQTVSWQDSGLLQWRILTSDYSGSLGLALAHPTYIAIGRFFLMLPFGSEALRINSASGVGMALALANLTLIGVYLTGSRFVGFAVSAMLSVAHTVWWLSTIAEVYTWDAAIFTAELLVLIRLIKKPTVMTAVILFFLSGIELGIHNFALLPLPVYVVSTALLFRNNKMLPLCVVLFCGAFLAGAAPIIFLVFQNASVSGDLRAVLLSALFGQYSAQVLNSSPAWHYMKVNAALTSLNFINILLPLAAVGWFRMPRRTGTHIAAPLMIIAAVHVVFFIRYPVPDQVTFVVPSLIMTGIASMMGIKILSECSALHKKFIVVMIVFSMCAPPFCYRMLPSLLENSGVAPQRDRTLPFRDEMRYWATPWKHNEISARRFAETALREAEPRSIILCDSTSYYPLKLVQKLYSLKPDVTVEKYGTFLSLARTAPDDLYAFFLENSVYAVSESYVTVYLDVKKRLLASRTKHGSLYRLDVQEINR